MYGSAGPKDAQAQPLLFAAKDVAYTEGRDHFPTPVPSVVQAVKAFGWDLTGKRVLDPSCGWGNVLEAAKLLGASETFGIELDSTLADMAERKGHNITRGDSLALEWPEVDYIIGNPPFSLALPFAWKLAKTCCDPTPDELYIRVWPLGMFLLELDFFASDGRRPLHDAHKPCVGILSSRISFNGDDGQTAKRNYAWFAYGTDAGGTFFHV